MRASLTSRAALTAAAACLTVVSAGSSAFAATGGTYTVPIHQTVPVTAAGFAEHEATCGGIGAGQDGWHFVLPGSSTDFVRLTVAFDNGAPQVVTVFGPPTTKHAYVGSAPGAKLTSATAEVKGGEVQWFNLSHTCPATAVTPSGTPSLPAPGTTPGTTASPSATVSASASASPSATASPTASASASTATSPGPTVTADRSAGASAGASVDAVARAAASAGPSGSAAAVEAAAGSDSLASTGANIGFTVLAAVGLVGAGSVLVMRRRARSGQH